MNANAFILPVDAFKNKKGINGYLKQLTRLKNDFKGGTK